MRRSTLTLCTRRGAHAALAAACTLVLACSGASHHPLGEPPAGASDAAGDVRVHPSSDTFQIDMRADASPDADAGPTADVGPGAAGGLPDRDHDGIPDFADPFPNDPTRPGSAKTETVYAQTATNLYSFVLKTRRLTHVGTFVWPQDDGDHEMTDIAIDRYGVLYGISFDHLYTCQPSTAICYMLATLPEQFNGLTMVPPGTLDQRRGVLIGISNTGDWYRLDVKNGAAVPTRLGSYGNGYDSAGDAYSLKGIGTYAAVTAPGDTNDRLVVVDPKNGKVVHDIGPITGYSEVYGLAGWTARAYAFDGTGAILAIDTKTGHVTLLQSTHHTWWGAGVRSEVQ